MYNTWLGTPALLAIFIETVYRIVLVKYITLVFTIPNNVGMDSVKRGNENL
jgi:hypothetical protein